MASMIKWLLKVNPSLKGLYPKPDDPFLPDPNLESSGKEARACSSAVCAKQNSWNRLQKHPSKPNAEMYNAR